MDPNANRDEALRLAKAIVKKDSESSYGGLGMDASAIHLSNYVIALDKWICEGGALPRAWQPPTKLVGASIEQALPAASETRAIGTSIEQGRPMKPDEPRAGEEGHLSGWSEIILDRKGQKP